MATGDQSNIVSRLWALLPPSWFPAGAANVTAALNGPATALSFIYSMIVFAKAQTRLATMSGIFLDLAAFDFFGRRIKRKPGQRDASFSALIRREVFRRRVTRGNVQQALVDLTGAPVTIFEPFNPQDTGGLGARWALNEPTSAIGSMSLPYTMFISAVEPPGAGIPNLSGLNDAQSGLGSSWFGLADLSTISGNVTNQDIYDTVEANRAAGITCWVKIGPAPIPAYRIGWTFAIGVSPLN